MTNTTTTASEQTGTVYLSAEDIREFQGLVRETTGVWLDEDAAARSANQLLYLTRALIGRLPEERLPQEF